MKGYGKHGQLINLLPCKGEESTLLSALCFFIDRIIAEKRVRDRSVWGSVYLCSKSVYNTASKAMCLCVWEIVWASIALSLSLGQASSLSACGLDAAPHSLPIIPMSPGASLSHNSPPRWDEVITLRTLHLLVHPCVYLCVVSMCGGVYYPQTSPVITHSLSSLQRFCSRTRLFTVE